MSKCLVVAASFLLLLGCAPTPETCRTRCNPEGFTCEPGTSDDACGNGGGLCVGCGTLERCQVTQIYLQAQTSSECVPR